MYDVHGMLVIGSISFHYSDVSVGVFVIYSHSCLQPLGLKLGRSEGSE